MCGQVLDTLIVDREAAVVHHVFESRSLSISDASFRDQAAERTVPDRIKSSKGINPCEGHEANDSRFLPAV